MITRSCRIAAGVMLLVLAGCGHGPASGKARLAVVVSEAGDPEGTRAGSIARRYGSTPGTFDLEISAETHAAAGDAAAHNNSSATVVFDVEGDVARIKADIEREPFVVSVSER